MFTLIRQPSSSFAASLKPLAGVATAALLIGWAAGVGAQSVTPPPLPPLQGDTSQKAGPQPQAALLGTNSPVPAAAPLSREDVKETQNQLIALGFDPGTADGEAGPATVSAAQQYDQSRGGSGRVNLDSAFLARLKADAAPRLTYEQVAARSQARAQAHSQARSSSGGGGGGGGGSQFGGLGSIVQQIAPLIGAAVQSSNANNNGYGNGYGYPNQGYPNQGYPNQGYQGYPGQGYPGPSYGGYRFGGY